MAFENLAAKARMAELVARRGDGFATDPRVVELDDETFSLYMEICLHCDESGEWGRCRRGLPVSVALGQAFVAFMLTAGGPWAIKGFWGRYGRAYEVLAAKKLIWARDGRLRVYTYWRTVTVDIGPLPGSTGRT